MDLDDFCRHVSGVVGISNRAGSTTRTLLEEWAYEGLTQILIRTGVKVEALTINLAADVVDYTLATSILRIKKLWVTDEPETVLEERSLEDILLLRQSQADGQLLYYHIEGHDFLMVHGTPSTGDTLTGLQIARPSAFASGAATPDGLPEEYHDVWLSYGKWKAAEWDDDSGSQEGLAFMAQYEEGIKRILSDLNRRRGKRGPFKPKRTRRYSRRNGVDYGV